MIRLLEKLAVAAVVGTVFFSRPSLSQILAPQDRAEHVAIIKGPELELARDDLAIIRWTSTNPGGDDDHFAVIYFGTDPEELRRTAKSHIRLNRGHAETIFRVRVDGLTPRTTYYYVVTSMGGNGQSDGVQSPVNQFTTTAAPGQQIRAYSQPK